MPRFRHIFRYIAACSLHYSGALRVSAWVRRSVMRRREVVVLGLHRVLNGDQVCRTLSEPCIVVQLRTFLALIQILDRKFRVLTLSEFTSRKLPATHRPLCLVTFDDAWLDTFENAFPALREHGIPAVVFAPTGLLSAEQAFWVEKVR
jgi:hypothetical protein